MMKELEQMTGGAEEAAAAAQAAGLRYISDEEPGITRRRRGKGFSYLAPGGRVLRDAGQRERLNSLAIPPAWTDVWISPDPDGHLQATGRDDQGRKQYIYHPDWRAIRDERKYARMVPFARKLPQIRRRTSSDLRKKGLPREKVLAVVVRLLESSLIRVGNEEYTRRNQSYGLTTMRDRHASVEGSTVRFEFRGKSGRRHSVDVRSRQLARVVKQCQDVPGQDLFQYLDDEGSRQDITSADVNDYLREIAGEEFTAKDFRTWAGTLHAATALLECGPSEEEKEARGRVTETVKRVAERLGNTPTICRQCYIHPTVIDVYLEGALGELLDPGSKVVRYSKVKGLTEEESAVLALLEESVEMQKT